MENQDRPKRELARRRPSWEGGGDGLVRRVTAAAPERTRAATLTESSRMATDCRSPRHRETCVTTLAHPGTDIPSQIAARRPARCASRRAPPSRRLGQTTPAVV